MRKYNRKYQPGGVANMIANTVKNSIPAMRIKTDPFSLEGTDLPYEEPDVHEGDYPVEPSHTEKTVDGGANNSLKVDPYFAFRGIKNGMSFLSGIAERNRQNSYLRNQLSTYGQLDAVPVNNFQPAYNNMYFQLGATVPGRNPASSTRNVIPIDEKFLKEVEQQGFKNTIEFDRYKRDLQKKGSIDRAGATDNYQKAINLQRNKNFASTRPNVVMKDDGSLESRNIDRDFEGRAISPNAKRFDKGLDHIMTGLDAAAVAVPVIGGLSRLKYTTPAIEGQVVTSGITGRDVSNFFRQTIPNAPKNVYRGAKNVFTRGTNPIKDGKVMVGDLPVELGETLKKVGKDTKYRVNKSGENFIVDGIDTDGKPFNIRVEKESIPEDIIFDEKKGTFINVKPAEKKGWGKRLKKWGIIGGAGTGIYAGRYYYNNEYKPNSILDDYKSDSIPKGNFKVIDDSLREDYIKRYRINNEY